MLLLGQPLFMPKFSDSQILFNLYRFINFNQSGGDMVLSVERRWLPNQSRDNGGDWVLDFTVDDTSDVSTLPTIGQEYAGMIVDGRPVVLSGGSSAFVVNTSTVNILGSSGWRSI